MNYKKCNAYTDGDDFSNINIEDNPNKDYSIYKTIIIVIITILVFVLVNISMYFPYFIYFCGMYSGAMGASQGLSIFNNLSVMLIGITPVLCCLQVSSKILNKFMKNFNYFSGKLYKCLCNILCVFYLFVFFICAVPMIISI